MVFRLLMGWLSLVLVLQVFAVTGVESEETETDELLHSTCPSASTVLYDGEEQQDIEHEAFYQDAFVDR